MQVKLLDFSFNDQMRPKPVPVAESASATATIEVARFRCPPGPIVKIRPASLCCTCGRCRCDATLRADCGGFLLSRTRLPRCVVRSSTTVTSHIRRRAISSLPHKVTKVLGILSRSGKAVEQYALAGMELRTLCMSATIRAELTRPPLLVIASYCFPSSVPWDTSSCHSSPNDKFRVQR
jgi:hypothetical protein